eukprot:CAMPEP_0196659056 /NCGR_PEP_ID=MMETSP1086-20130531/32897_1 /TAXON_ID=77921 /ORGANISM="Cyanoptyche  gloeocystis , Strain SAG4.97" /LENGTH=187 /DNA_ID=CAMNT_0041992889 /DNA_START=66 /DNA_END=629 /DNA_ORIENTATION=+
MIRSRLLCAPRRHPDSKLCNREPQEKQCKAQKPQRCVNDLFDFADAEVVDCEETASQHHLRPKNYASDSTTEFDDTMVEEMLFHMEEEWLMRTNRKAACGSLKLSHMKEAFKEYNTSNMQCFLDVDFCRDDACVELENSKPFLAAVQHSANLLVQGNLQSSISSSIAIARSNPIPIPGNKNQRSFTL